jgi:metacaspase-1
MISVNDRGKKCTNNLHRRYSESSSNRNSMQIPENATLDAAGEYPNADIRKFHLKKVLGHRYISHNFCEILYRFRKIQAGNYRLLSKLIIYLIHLQKRLAYRLFIGPGQIHRGSVTISTGNSGSGEKGIGYMAQGLALTIGLNAVDAAHYGGWSGVLNACEADAGDMRALAQSCSFGVKTLLTAAATRKNLTAEITRAAGELKTGDIFLLSYSGHGGQLPDLSGEEPDDLDETWCLYDGQLLDDEIHDLLAKFSTGVRILVLSDSCHSGTVTRMAYYRSQLFNLVSGTRPVINYRFMPPEIALRTYRDNRVFYEKLQKSKHTAKTRPEVQASVLLISGCQDNQYSADGIYNGLFTSQLLRVWNNGKFSGTYKEFHQAIVRRMPPDQTPNYFWNGVYDANFEVQKPFTI